MDHINIPSTAVTLSRLGLGTVKFGRNEGVKYPQAFDLPDDYTITALLDAAQDCGVNVLDTAPAYGASEERIGQLLTNRTAWTLISKAGEEFEHGQSSHNFTPEHFTMSLERSLKRLRTDYLDILLIHSNGDDLQILNNAKLIRRMQDFKAKGMVRAIGASTKTIEGGIRALDVFDTAMVAFSPAQPDELAVLNHAQKTGKVVLLKKVLDSGHNTNIKQALEFCFAPPCMSCAIIGTISPSRLRQNAQAAMQALSSLAGAQSGSA